MYRIITSLLDFPALNSKLARRCVKIETHATLPLLRHISYHSVFCALKQELSRAKDNAALPALWANLVYCVYSLHTLHRCLVYFYSHHWSYSTQELCIYAYSGYSVYYVCICKLYYTLSSYYTLLYNCARGELCAACLFSPSALIWPVMKRCTRSHFDI